MGYVDEEYPEKFLASLNEVRKTDVLCNYDVKVDNESLNVHTAVLAAASEYFASVFQPTMKRVIWRFGSAPLSIVGVRKCIEYMYSGSVTLENDSVEEETLKASIEFKLDWLTSICSKLKKPSLSVETSYSAHNTEYDKAHPVNMLKALNEMRKSDRMCDCTIKVGLGSFNVHSVVLAAASKYFAAKFSNETHVEKMSGEVPYEKIAGEVPQEKMSGEVPHEKMSGEVPQEKMSGAVPSREKAFGGVTLPHQTMSGKVPHEKMSGEVPQEEMSGEVPHEKMSGEVPQEEMSGKVPQEEMFADLTSPHKKALPLPHDIGMRRCIDYIYTGAVMLDSYDSVRKTLEASNAIDLDGLTSICFECMKNKIFVDTCLSALNLSILHRRDDVISLADKYIKENFEAVTLTESFARIIESDPLHYNKASNAYYNLTWKAVMRWYSTAKDTSGQVLFHVMNSISLSKFPFQFLLDTVLDEPLLKQHDSCYKLVIDSLFEDVDKVKSSLSTENFFVVENLTKSPKIPNLEEVKKAIGDYLAENFESLVEKDEFCNLGEAEIVDVFQAPKIKISSEKAKWKAALKWTKHDPPRRKKMLEKLFKSIELERLPYDLLQQAVEDETLVKEVPQCLVALLDVLSARRDGKPEKDASTLVPYIACSDRMNKKIKALNLTTMNLLEGNPWKVLPSLGLSVTSNSKLQVVNANGKMYCLVNEKLFTYDQTRMSWDLIRSLPKLRGYVEVVAVKNLIYTLNRNTMIYYDVNAKAISEKDLPGCGLDDHFCAASSDESVYAMGGKINNKITEVAKRYKPTEQQWRDIGPLNTGRIGASAAVLHEKVYIAGGWDGSECLYSVEVYSPISNYWTYAQRMRTRRYLSSACVAENELYVVGGACDKRGGALNPGSVEVYKEDSDEWKIVNEYHDGSKFTSCCPIKLLSTDQSA